MRPLHAPLQMVCLEWTEGILVQISRKISNTSSLVSVHRIVVLGAQVPSLWTLLCRPSWGQILGLHGLAWLSRVHQQLLHVML